MKIAIRTPSNALVLLGAAGLAQLHVALEDARAPPVAVVAHHELGAIVQVADALVPLNAGPMRGGGRTPSDMATTRQQFSTARQLRGK